ncbi:MAG: pyrimidine 5'-nucleotidase [Anaerolineaceae bacterium]|nr:pyrimidine 5'-nucleotidase [Anaerolineaceae bacterium]
MALTTLFVDLDDTVYPPSSGIWPMIKQRIAHYMVEKIGLPEEVIPDLRRGLFEEYGSTLRGLERIYGTDPEDYLAYVHDVPVEDCIHPDPVLREVLLGYPQPKIIFTNSDTQHAERVLNALQLRDCFSQIIDIHKIAPACKPQPAAFQAALKETGWPRPHDCLLVDDSPQNLATAREIGFYTIQVGPLPTNPVAHHCIHRLADLPQVAPADLSW